MTVECLTWLLVMYFGPAPKHMIRLSVDYWQDSKIPIQLWKSLVGDTPNIYIYILVWNDGIMLVFCVHTPDVRLRKLAVEKDELLSQVWLYMKWIKMYYWHCWVENTIYTLLDQKTEDAAGGRKTKALKDRQCLHRRRANGERHWPAFHRDAEYDLWHMLCTHSCLH